MAKPDVECPRIVIIGGVAAGATAAASARRENESAEIVLLERGPYVSFASCGLPFFFSGEVPHRAALLIQSPETLQERYRLDVRPGHEVIAIDRAARTVRIRVNEHARGANPAAGSEFDLSWDRLILATGGSPLPPDIPGANGPGCFTMWNMGDLDRLHAYMQEHKPKQALVIGGGFVGLEMAESLCTRGLKVRIVESSPCLLPNLDPEFSQAVRECVEAAGVEVFCSSEVVEIDGKQHVATIQSHSQHGLDAASDQPHKLAIDVVILAIGTRSNTSLAIGCGLELGQSGGVRVTRHLQASIDTDIYVAGDLAEIPLRITKQGVRLPLAGPANRQGRIAGANAARSLAKMPGHTLESYNGALGTWIVRIFGQAVAGTGLSEKAANAMKFRTGAVIIHRTPRSAWLGNAGAISLKITYNRNSGALLGAQVFGTDGIDKRVDVLAAALQGNLGVHDLLEMDLSYAPPFNSANDPINYAGMVACNDINGSSPSLSPAEFLRRFDTQEDLVLDVRMPSEVSNGHIPGSLNIPIDDLRRRLGEIPRDRKHIYVHCAAGFRAHLAIRILLQNGFDQVYNISGGWMSIRFFFPAPTAQMHH